MRGANHSRQTGFRFDINCRHQIQTQQRQVGQIVVRQTGFAANVRVQTTHAVKARLPQTRTILRGQDNLAGVADDDGFDMAFTVDQHADLPANFVRNFRQLSSEILRDDFLWRNAALEHLFQAL